MYQALIFGSTLAAGLALFGMAAWIQADRSAFTSRTAQTSEPVVRTHIASLKPESTEPTPTYTVVDLAPIEITAKPRATPRKVHSAPTAVEPALATTPCSPWQEIGPQHVDDGAAIGVRRVRTLCPSPSVAGP